jgi:hypothetical protein
MNLVCFTEEQSAKEMLQVVLPKILPDNCPLSRVIAFEGKSDLDKQIERKLKIYNTPNTHFLILRDQDSADCTKVKQQLLTKVKNSGKTKVSIVRIACHEKAITRDKGQLSGNIFGKTTCNISFADCSSVKHTRFIACLKHQKILVSINTPFCRHSPYRF